MTNVLSRETNKTKNLPKKPCFVDKFSENSIKQFFAQTQDHMNTGHMLRVIRRHTLEANFQVMTVAVKLSKRAMTIEKNCSTSKEYLGQTTPIFDRTYAEKFTSASLGYPAGVTNPILLLFVQQDKKSLGESTSLKGTYFLTIFGKKSVRKVRSKSKLASKPTFVHLA